MIMQIDNILPVPKRYLLLANAIVWGVPGVKVFLTGLKSYFLLDTSAPLILLLLGSALVLCCFLILFNKIVNKYSNRIISFQQQKESLLYFLPLKGWILVIFMMGLGITLKHIPCIPVEFFACFYCGIGPALTTAAIIFLYRFFRTK